MSKTCKRGKGNRGQCKSARGGDWKSMMMPKAKTPEEKEKKRLDNIASADAFKAKMNNVKSNFSGIKSGIADVFAKGRTQADQFSNALTSRVKQVDAVPQQLSTIVSDLGEIKAKLGILPPSNMGGKKSRKNKKRSKTYRRK